MPAPRNRITAIGLELEGGWTAVPPGPVFQDPREPSSGREIIKRDGSVRLDSRDLLVGEVVSAPLPDTEAAIAWLRANYPQAGNNTCGFHIHISLPSLHYSRLMNEEFNNKFLASMEAFWDERRGNPGFDLFRSRLDGQNRYCQKIFRPEEQLWRTEHYGDHAVVPRYSQLNYCWGRHGTMECRLFPYFPKVADAIATVETFTGCVNSFLATVRPEAPYKFEVTFDPNKISTHTNVSA